MPKEIIIDGDNSDWFEKAIFILKDNKKLPRNQNLFEYAEEIIETQIKKMPYSNNVQSSKVNLNIKDVNRLYIEQQRFAELKKVKSHAKRTRCIIDIFLYTTIVLTFICIMCFMFKI